MKEERFYKLVDKFHEDCMAIMHTKGQAYSGKEDKLGNFKRVAKNLSMTPEQVWYVYFSKHLDALSAYLRGEYVDSEPIMGRIKDLINYLYLFMGLYEEKQEDATRKEYYPFLESEDDATGDDIRIVDAEVVRTDTEDGGDTFDEKIGK